MKTDAKIPEIRLYLITQVISKIANKEEELEKKVEKRIIPNKKLVDYTHLDTYFNNRFGFSVKYPSSLLTKKTYPENGDGVWLSNNEGTVTVIPSASYAIDINTAKQMYKNAISWKKENKAVEITYKRQKNNWYVLSGYDHSNNTIFYEKYYLINGISSGFSIVFLIKDKKKYNKLVNIIASSFKPSYGEL